MPRFCDNVQSCPFNIPKFLAKIDIRSPDECWSWLAAKFNSGYGCFGIGKERRAHRLAYLYWVDEIPSGKLIRHKCDNPGCVNPNHLEIGTPLENMADAKERNRLARGLRNGNGKLSDNDVIEIRRRYIPWDNCSSLAKEFGINRCTVHHIIKGRYRPAFAGNE